GRIDRDLRGELGSVGEPSSETARLQPDLKGAGVAEALGKMIEVATPRKGQGFKRRRVETWTKSSEVGKDNLGLVLPLQLGEARAIDQLPEPPCRARLRNGGSVERGFGVAPGNVVCQGEAEVAEEVGRILRIDAECELVPFDRFLGLASPGQHRAHR